MSVYVVDASVVIKWLLPEIHSAEALRLLQGDPELHAPDLMLAEVGNFLWKKERRGELTNDETRRAARDVLEFPICIHASRPLLEGAVVLAGRTGRTVYDSLYVTLAAALDCRMVTADRKLIEALASHGIGGRTLWVEDVRAD